MSNHTIGCSKGCSSFSPGILKISEQNADVMVLDHNIISVKCLGFGLSHIVQSLKGAASELFEYLASHFCSFVIL